MTEGNERIKELITRHLKSELSNEESKELESWIQDSEKNRSLFHELTDPVALAENLQEFHEAKLAIREKIERSIGETMPATRTAAPVRNLRPRTRVYAAACVLIALCTGIYYWSTRSPTPAIAKTANASQLLKNDILPGGTKAILKLADGSTILLDSAKNGKLADEGNAEIVKQAGGKLTYKLSAANPASTPLVYNTLSTPRAGQFEVTLPDGTKVWLNNASSLRYPTAFTGQDRIVTLSGEAYFEVAPIVAASGHGRMPFKVNVTPSAETTQGILVEVLGTHFNIMAYSNEAAVQTTLLEGKVKVSRGSREAVLQPGEQAAIGQNDNWSLLKGVDTEGVVDWKNGLFHFDHADLPAVMRQLARWYDVDVEYQGMIPAHVYEGDIHRDLTLTQVLENLANKDVHFQLEGRKVIVSSSSR